MDIYKINAQSLNLIKEQPFKLEKEMQEMFEKNLQMLTGLPELMAMEGSALTDTWPTALLLQPLALVPVTV